MNTPDPSILQSLDDVAAERARRAGDPSLAARVAAVKRHQTDRFRRSHADLIADPRCERAARFFLDELYGPADFSRRDAQFARVAPAVSKLFPRDIVETVAALARLHALSERLDTAMAETLPGAAFDDADYARAWRTVGRPDERERQIALMQAVGSALDRHTRNPMLLASLKLMRAPAAAAGLGTLQDFLERGVDAFRSMRGGGELLATIASRERAIAERLFAGAPAADGDPASPA